MAQVRSDLTTTRSFNYTKGNTSLKFSLNIDSKTEIKDFKACLDQALEDIKKELES